MTLMLCDPVPYLENELAAVCVVYATTIATEVVRIVENDTVWLRTGYCACPDTKTGFHTILTVNGRHGFCSIHWNTAEEALNFAMRSWEAANTILVSLHIHPATGHISVN